MEKKRYQFYDYYGIRKGLSDTDNLEEAIQLCFKFQCEVVDTEALGGTDIVFSVWDGWNVDWYLYDKNKADELIEKIQRGEKENREMHDRGFYENILEEVKQDTSIETLWMLSCSGNIEELKKYFSSSQKKLNCRYCKNGKENSLIMGAFRNGEFDTVDYLLSVGETTTSEEEKKILFELRRIDTMRKIVGNGS